jgi:nucleotide-binding universal stress UspA family protein
MFQRILVPTDLTERADKALDLALTLSAPDNSSVMLLHVIETFRGLDFEEMKPYYQKFEKKAQGILGAARARLPKASANVVQEIVYGDRAEEIVKFASAHQIDLIVLASHRVDPSLIGRDWGTISYKVGILAQCPVLLVK